MVFVYRHGSRKIVLGAVAVPLAIVAVWCAVEWTTPRPSPPPDDPPGSRSVSSQVCAQCHEAQFASWHRTFHRTMTREATPENVNQWPYAGGWMLKLKLTNPTEVDGLLSAEDYRKSIA